MGGPHVHYWHCLPFEDGIVVETCACSAVHFSPADWEYNNNRPDSTTSRLLLRADELNSKLGKEGNQMPRVFSLKRVSELPAGFTPRPVIPDGTPLYTRNMTIGRWHDENKAAIKELFEKDSYQGLQKQLGMSFATAKGLLKRWDKAEQRAASPAGQAKPPPEADRPPAQPTAGEPAPPLDNPLQELGVCVWPPYSALDQSAQERLKWLDKTAELALAGKVVLK